MYENQKDRKIRLLPPYHFPILKCLHRFPILFNLFQTFQVIMYRGDSELTDYNSHGLHVCSPLIGRKSLTFRVTKTSRWTIHVAAIIASGILVLFPLHSRIVSLITSSSIGSTTDSLIKSSKTCSFAGVCVYRNNSIFDFRYYRHLGHCIDNVRDKTHPVGRKCSAQKINNNVAV